MCRLLGIVSSEPVDFRLCLREAPRSVATLSREHRDGWGVAVFDESTGWALQKAPRCAVEDDRFHEVALGSRGVLMMAHVRKGTVGCLRLENTHPFQYGPWVFAHNGTVVANEWIDAHTPSTYRMAVRGETDSERLFAFLLAQLDPITGLGGPRTRAQQDKAILDVVTCLERQPGCEAATFLVSDGQVLYAYRSGRTLYLLQRRPGDAVLTRRASNETRAIVETPWSERRTAILIASEQITDEPWQTLAEGALIRVERLPEPTYVVLRESRTACAAAS